MSSTQKPDNSQAGQYRRPAYANWPTIKLTQPPAGRYSPKTDEWFFVFCTQSVKGRIHGQDPHCRSFSFRKVMPHEVRNVANFKSHTNLGPDGKARYPLPKEGQPENVPKIFGGNPVVEMEDDDDDDESDNSSPLKTTTPERKFWDEGWYFWTSNSHTASWHALLRMKHDLGHLSRVDMKIEKDRARWLEYKQFLERNSITDFGKLDQYPDGSQWLTPRPPLQPIPDTSKHALLIPIPPTTTPFWERIDKVLAPSQRMLSIFSDSVTSGEQKKFALRAWEKAWTPEPLVLAKRTFDKVFEMWKDMGEDDK